MSERLFLKPWTSGPVVNPEKGGIPRFVQVACLAKSQILNGSEVGKLKVLCESLFKLKSIRLRLFLQEEAGSFGSPDPECQAIHPGASYQERREP
ncbi:hypothetical protein QJS10_CPA08g00879 [Acorus calamus]|uniref:Uncharacterized protein n=1 Tax=Acorus calamus TaxID=4465 RepID=A0AAV9ECK8_ACOCL|nr:hypothetical protein QJS10_CPA08g00879 [Acorus calamus]